MSAPRSMLLAGLCALLLAAPAALVAAPQTQDVEARYKEASADFHRARSTPGATPERWRAVAEQFQRIHAQALRQPRGADALFSVGLAFHEAFAAGGTAADLSGAQAAFERFAEEFPRHALADDSLMHVAEIQERDRQDPLAAAATYRRVTASYPNGALRKLAEQRLAALGPVAQAASGPAAQSAQAPSAQPNAPRPALAAQPERKPQPAAPAPTERAPAPAAEPQPVALKRIQVLAALQFTRIILTTSGPVAFRHSMAGGSQGNTVRVSLEDTRADGAIQLPGPSADGLLRQVSLARSGGGTELTFAAQALRSHDVKQFDLPTETKLVVDLYPQDKPRAVARTRAKRVPRGPAAPVPAEQLQASLRTSLALKVKSIMLDPGHGGHDPGAISEGIYEKDVALAIARALRGILHARHPDMRVGMTRDSDEFVSLSRRPELAKSFGADLFVSIHLNANPIHRFQGVETYFLNLTSDASAMAVAARENATSEKRVSDLNGILLDLLRDTNILESSKLAAALHSSLVDQLRDVRPVHDLGVKQAPFMVLIGAEMPSVLVEAGFVTNPEEAALLKDPQYVRSIAEGIYAGLEKYIEGQDVAQLRGTGNADRLVSQRSSP